MQDLSIRQIDEAIQGAVERHIPLTLSVQSDGWVNLHSRFVTVCDEHLLVELPPREESQSYEFAPAQKVAMSFKLKHHKYITTARVAEISFWTQENGTETKVLVLCFPMQMQRLQRRNFTRVAVPAGRIVRVSFWSGDKESEPAGVGDASVWAGRVVDFSAGGFQTILSEEPELSEGQPVGVRLAFGPGETSIYADAQYRHGHEREDGLWSLGFQFIGLAHTEQGRDVLRLLGQKMSEFTRFASRARHFAANRTA